MPAAPTVPGISGVPGVSDIHPAIASYLGGMKPKQFQTINDTFGQAGVPVPWGQLAGVPGGVPGGRFQGGGGVPTMGGQSFSWGDIPAAARAKYEDNLRIGKTHQTQDQVLEYWRQNYQNNAELQAAEMPKWNKSLLAPKPSDFAPLPTASDQFAISAGNATLAPRWASLVFLATIRHRLRPAGATATDRGRGPTADAAAGASCGARIRSYGSLSVADLALEISWPDRAKRYVHCSRPLGGNLT